MAVYGTVCFELGIPRFFLYLYQWFSHALKRKIILLKTIYIINPFIAGYPRWKNTVRLVGAEIRTVIHTFRTVYAYFRCTSGFEYVPFYCMSKVPGFEPYSDWLLTCYGPKFHSKRSVLFHLGSTRLESTLERIVAENTRIQTYYIISQVKNRTSWKNHKILHNITN